MNICNVTKIFPDWGIMVGTNHHIADVNSGQVHGYNSGTFIENIEFN